MLAALNIQASSQQMVYSAFLNQSLLQAAQVLFTCGIKGSLDVLLVIWRSCLAFHNLLPMSFLSVEPLSGSKQIAAPGSWSAWTHLSAVFPLDASDNVHCDAPCCCHGVAHLQIRTFELTRLIEIQQKLEEFMQKYYNAGFLNKHEKGLQCDMTGLCKLLRQEIQVQEYKHHQGLYLKDCCHGNDVSLFHMNLSFVMCFLVLEKEHCPVYLRKHL